MQSKKSKKKYKKKVINLYLAICVSFLSLTKKIIKNPNIISIILFIIIDLARIDFLTFYSGLNSIKFKVAFLFDEVLDIIGLSVISN